MVPGPAGFPLSRAVRVGDTLYVSGNFGWDAANSRVVPGGAAAETRQTLENMGKVLRQAGSSFDKVVKTTVMRHTSTYLSYLSYLLISTLVQVWLTHYDEDMTEVNRVYATFFDSRHYPARAAYGVSALPAGARVEIEAVAIVGDIIDV